LKLAVSRSRPSVPYWANFYSSSSHLFQTFLGNTTDRGIVNTVLEELWSVDVICWVLFVFLLIQGSHPKNSEKRT